MEVVTGIVGVVSLLVLVYLGYVLLKGEDRR